MIKAVASRLKLVFETRIEICFGGGDSQAVKERLCQEFREGQHGGPSIMTLVVAAREGNLEDTLKSYPAPLRELFADLLKDIKKDVVPVVSISDS